MQGAGAAIITPASLALLSAAFPPERRGRALGIFGGITGLAVVAGPVVGGAVTQGLAWQWIFWLNVPIGLAALPLVLTRMDESVGPRAALDTPGLSLVTGAALGIVWGLVRGNTAGLLMFGALFSAVFFMAQFQQTVLGQSPLQAGLRLIPWTGTVFIVAPIAGALVDRIGERPLIVSGLLLQAAGLAWVAVLARTGLPYREMVPPLILAGVGISMAIPATQNSVMNAVAPTEIGKASGTFSTMRQLGGAFGLALGVAVFTGGGSYASPGAFSAGFGPAMAVSAGLSLCGALAGISLRVPGIARGAPALEIAGGGR